VADKPRVADELATIEQIMNTAFFVINPILLVGPQMQEPAAAEPLINLNSSTDYVLILASSKEATQ